MELLKANELIYGRLLAISEPHLIARYNKALAAFGLPPTRLERFSIDRTGFSPEIAEELDDPHYLDPNQVNRRFIILTPMQKDLPVVHTAFSNTGQLMHAFYQANQRAIDALTIKDVIFGEIEEAVSKVADIEDLLSINQVEFKVLSAEDMTGKAAELASLADRLRQEPEAWRDDALLSRMVELVKITGDIRATNLVPEHLVFRHSAFWTSHFGGLYVFNDPRMTTVICDPSAPGFRRSRPWQVSYLSIHDAAAVHAFLEQTGRLDPPRASWLETSGYLDHRAEMVLQWLYHRTEPESRPGPMDAVFLQTWVHRNADIVAQDGSWPFLHTVRRLLAQTGRLDLSDVEPRRRFLVLRARPDHEDAWLINSLISEFVPQDFVSRYIFNKPAFYRDYEGHPEGWRKHIVETLKATYLRDKAAFRARLYGLKD
jgi:hypothetical protein